MVAACGVVGRERLTFTVATLLLRRLAEAVADCDLRLPCRVSVRPRLQSMKRTSIVPARDGSAGAARARDAVSQGGRAEVVIRAGGSGNGTLDSEFTEEGTGQPRPVAASPPTSSQRCAPKALHGI